MVKEEIRCFVAVKIHQNIKDELSAAQGKMRRLECPVTWVDVENLHLTLKFLGSAPAEEIPNVVDCLNRVLKNKSAGDLLLTVIGAFPNKDIPKIIWAGVDNSHLFSLVNDIESSLSPLGFPQEGRLWHPHITLGRVKSSKGIGRLKEYLSKEHKFKNICQRVEEVVLYRSDLKPQGSVYTPIKAFHLPR